MTHPYDDTIKQMNDLVDDHAGISKLGRGVLMVAFERVAKDAYNAGYKAGHNACSERLGLGPLAFNMDEEDWYK